MAEQEVSANAIEQSSSEADIPDNAVRVGIFSGAKAWFQDEGPWWLCSFVFHLVLVCSLALVSAKIVPKIVDEAPSFEEARMEKPDVPQDIERFDVGETPEEPTELNNDTLALEKPAAVAVEEKYYDDSATFTEAGGGVAANTTQPNLGGLGGFDIKGLASTGPAVKGKGGGVGVGVGSGTHAGMGGDGWGFGGRGTGSRKAMLGSGGGTRQSERAVAGALSWIARHQSRDGSWSLANYKASCKDSSCAGPAAGDRCGGATALALLPFLGAGQTHEGKSKYKTTIRAGIAYLVNKQGKDGDLRLGGQMYDHGLASIALCECYGMTGDKTVGRAAQLALNFIAEAQDPAGGGWRYAPKEPGDTSVVGWQLMALKSGQMAYLKVDPVVFERAKAFMKSASSGTPGSLGFGGLFTYTPGGGATPPMTAVGLLCCQYAGASRTDPAMIEGTALLMGNQPDTGTRNLYFWYYATQVMHNQPGPDWDTWNRKMRRILIDTQCKEGNCADGSWDPKTPADDQWGQTGGRLYMTSLSALTLEVYYRYLPLYKLDKESGAPAERPAEPEKPAETPPAQPAEPPAAAPPTEPPAAEAPPAAPPAAAPAAENAAK